MPTYRFPIMVWMDLNNHFTASLLEDEYNIDGLFMGGSSVGTGKTAAEAIQQLKEYLNWSYEKHSWQPAPDFLDPKLITFRVDIRPEYHISEKIYPSEDIVRLQVACVHGKQEAGLLVCTIPMLGIKFYYHEAKNLKELVTSYVKERMKGLTPQQLSRFLPPKDVQLEEIVLHINRREPARKSSPNIKALEAIAEPIGERKFRRRFSRVWEREKEVDDLRTRLGKERANVLIVGESGVGKSTVIVDAIDQIEKELNRNSKESDTYIPHRFWLTSGARIISGMQYLGQWEERCEKIIKELSDIDGVLCIENLLDLLQTGGSIPASSVAAFLVPYIQRGELRVIAEATPTELDACRRLLPGLVDLFQILKISAFDRERAITILNRAIESNERNLKIKADKSIAESTYRIFNRFAPYQAFPGKALNFIDKVFEEASIERLEEIGTERVIREFIKQTGLPELFLRDDIPLNQVEVFNQFNREVIGQEAACDIAANIVTTFKAGLNDPNRPVGVLLFCGPTGVGKTELAKAISRFFFGAGDDKDRLIRLDMSEYSGPGSVERMIGDPNGMPSELVKRVRQQPFVVILLDEIEKADPEVFDIFLSVFDEGRLTDRYGRVTNFRSSIIVMTSNLGADKTENVGFSKQSGLSYSNEVMSFFRPEFYNRIDWIVGFKHLTEEVVHTITRKELTNIAKREGLVKSNLELRWTDDVVNFLAKEGFDARYGARPLQRTIETMIIAPLAKYLIENAGLSKAAVSTSIEDNRVVFDIASS
jgi:ATP-dependent Clp protease ATP-binding subunit ClpC